MPRRRLPSVAAATTTAVLLLVVAIVLLAGATAADADAARGKSKSLESAFLDPHNAARRAVGLRPLRWDERLAGYARRYAAARSGDCALAHSHGPYGENLFCGSGGSGWTPADVVGAWVRERALYDARANTCRAARGGASCGHYTQIVWRATTAVGCAIVPCAGGRATFAVCSYNPPGNYVGVRPY